jgi:MFS family permease
LAALPLMVGLIASSIGSGLIVARTGRYKWLLVGAIALMGVSTALMTQLTATTSLEVVWFWMFLAGLGVGPTFSVFTIVVQNAVPFHELGVATSNLTFFRQIGGTVALAIVGTIFGSTFTEQLAPQLAAAGVPAQVVQGFTQASGSGQIDFNQLTGVGDLGASILASVPAEARPFIEPFIANIVAGIHQAFSLGVAQTFWIGVIAAIVAALAAIGMQELTLRTSHAPAPEARARLTSAAATD